MEVQLFILGAALTIIGTFGLIILNSIRESVAEATKSIMALNVQVGKIIEKTERHDKEIDDMRSKQDAVRERIHGLANDINHIKARNYE